LIALNTLLGGSSDVTSLLAPMESFNSAGFSQQAESAADETALNILNCHYGHIGGATTLFEVIKKEEQGFDFSLIHYFSTHPQIQDRIDSINELGNALGFTTAKTALKEK
jgi:Zn-dependent protease with chaperone function